MDFSVTCKTTDGVPCDQLEYPDDSCSGPVDVLTFSYQNCSCASSENGQADATCQDFKPIVDTLSVVIVCVNEQGDMLSVDPMMVPPGGFFTVSTHDGLPLPDTMDCTLMNGRGVPFQRNTISVSGLEPLRLRNKFGAMQIEGCDELSCSAELCYEYTIANTGSDNMTVTRADRTFEGEQRSFLYLLEKNPLEPGDSFDLQEKQLIDLCTYRNERSNVVVEAEPNDGTPCRSGADFAMLVETPFPTSAPSASPSAPPSSGPTDSPSVEPSLSPSAQPSVFPSLEPSSEPSDAPSSAPSHEPTNEPSAAPTDVCTFNLDVGCILPNGDSCDVVAPAVEPCTGRPYRMGMLLRGGYCNQSDNVQPAKFFCDDVGEGPPTPRSGQRVYLVVVPTKIPETIYFEGYVNEGEIFYMEDGGLDLQADSNITMYTDESKSTVLQALQYHTSCSQNLRLKDTFGAFQLVEWVNEEQGVVSCFASVEYELKLNVPLDFEGDTLLVTSITATTNFADPLVQDLTDQASDMVIAAGDSLVVSFNSTFDLSERRRYTIATEIFAETANGAKCFSFDFDEFVAGSPIPPAFPTKVPTVAPSHSPYPTPDPMDAACDLDVSIECTVGTPKRRNEKNLCADIAKSLQPTCRGAPPTQLRFLYTGEHCDASNTTGKDFKCVQRAGTGASPVRILVTDKNKEIQYFDEEAIDLGTVVQVEAGTSFDKVLLITIMSGGKVVQEMQLRSTCKDEKDDISLMTHYGALQLVGYTSGSQGDQDIYQSIMYSFIVENRGLDAFIESATANTLLNGDLSLIAPPGTALARRETQVYKSSAVVNVYAMSGMVFPSTFQVTGVGQKSQKSCGADASDFFQL